MASTPESLESKGTMDQIYKAEIHPRVFEGIRRAQNIPRVVLVGGQPGSGKSSRIKHVLDSLDVPDPGTSIGINGDDDRAFHPRYYELLRVDDSLEAAKIDHDNSHIIESVITSSMSVGCNVVLEGTFRRPEIVRKTANRYRKAGYESRAVLMLVHPLLSRLVVLHRYVAQKMLSPFARFTIREAHDSAQNAIPKTAEALIKTAAVDLFSIVNRQSASLFDVQLAGLSTNSLFHLSKDALEIIESGHTVVTPEEIIFAREQLSEISNQVASIAIPEIIQAEFASLGNELRAVGRQP